MKINRRLLGIIAISITILAISFWAYWGIIETFHEGWYSESLTENIATMLLQYMSPMLVLISLTVTTLYFKRTGAIILLIVGIGLSFFIQKLILVFPFILLGVLFWFGEIKQTKRALLIILLVPFLLTIFLGVGPYLKVSKRFNDNNFTEQKVKGNGVELIWAPEGPGFPENGTSWTNAKVICEYLSEDGKKIESEKQGYWRLPTADELVRSATKGNVNCGGVLDTINFEASYVTEPDKESPLWKVYSKVIYRWTATEADEKHAYMICYDGKLWKRDKKYSANYLGFRAVRTNKQPYQRP